MESHTVRSSDGVELYIEETGPGDGPTVLFLHGYSQSRLSWCRQTDSTLADDYRLITPDLRGHGRSEKPQRLASYGDSELWAADVAAVIDALDYLRERGTDWVAGVNLIRSVSRMGTDAAAELLSPEHVELFPRSTRSSASASTTPHRRNITSCSDSTLPCRRASETGCARGRFPTGIPFDRSTCPSS